MTLSVVSECLARRLRNTLVDFLLPELFEVQPFCRTHGISQMKGRHHERFFFNQGIVDLREQMHVLKRQNSKCCLAFLALRYSIPFPQPDSPPHNKQLVHSSIRHHHKHNQQTRGAKKTYT
jgi:hypothetical protein